MTLSTDQRVPDPLLLRRPPFARTVARLAPGDIRATEHQRRVFLDSTDFGDPLADAVVETFRRLPTGQGRQLFEQALTHGIDAVVDAPPELVALFQQVESIPYWVDPDQLAHGARVIGRSGVAGHAALSMLALMGGYLASRVIKPVVATGDLKRMAPRRLAETVAWHSAVTAEGGLDRGAPGFQATLRVRLMHAMVRGGMARRPDWDHATWGHPINQSSVAGTLMLFGLVHLVGSQALGLRFTRSEREAVLALWRYVGYLLGVDPLLLPATERDWWRLAWIQASVEFDAPDQDSVELAQALMQAVGPMAIAGDRPHQRLARRAVTGILCGYARLALGAHNADFLGIPDHKPSQAAVVVSAAAVRAFEYARPLLPAATRWCEQFGRRSQEVWTTQAMTLHRGDTRYARHDNLAAADTPQTPLARPPRPADRGRVHPGSIRAFVRSARPRRPVEWSREHNHAG